MLRRFRMMCERNFRTTEHGAGNNSRQQFDHRGETAGDCNSFEKAPSHNRAWLVRSGIDSRVNTARRLTVFETRYTRQRA